MTDNFWRELKAPFFALAPMEDVTDTVFREVLMSVSNPTNIPVYFTEFTNVEGLTHTVGRAKVSHRLQLNESERILQKQQGTRLVAQIWGSTPEKFHEVAKDLSQRGDFDGIDINMGCPVKKVVKNKSCSALIQYPDLAREIIQATQEGSSIPVSVKTRIGFNEIETESWISNVLKTKPAALTIHGRIQKQMSEGEANWNEIAKAVQLRDELSPETVMLGNGDIESVGLGRQRHEETCVDGIMVGRGIFKNPWMFADEPNAITPEMRLELIQKHIQLFRETWEGDKNPAILKRFFKIYIQEFRGAGSLRADLMHVKEYDDFLKVLKEFDLEQA